MGRGSRSPNTWYRRARENELQATKWEARALESALEGDDERAISRLEHADVNRSLAGYDLEHARAQVTWLKAKAEQERRMVYTRMADDFYGRDRASWDVPERLAITSWWHEAYVAQRSAAIMAPGADARYFLKE